VSANVIGMFACYYIERTQRNEYLLRRRNTELVASLTAQTDAAERASREKTRFLAAASHDLRQPMHALGLWVRNLRGAAARGYLPAVTYKVGAIEDSVRALASSFDGIMQISRLDAGSFAPRIEDVELAPLLEQIGLIFGPLAAEKQIKVALLTQADGPHLSAYIPSLVATPEIASVAVAGLPDPKGLGPKLGGVYKDAAELFRKEKPGLALVTMEAAIAPPVIRAALEAGCHVLAEKPACVRAADFDALAAVADDDGVCVVPRLQCASVLAGAQAREQKEAAVRARLARGELGLDLYEMRDALAAKGLTYVDAKDS
jgi:hypothetical protein